MPEALDTFDFPSFSAIYDGVKGNNPEQVFKFLAWEMAKLSGVRAIEIYEQFEIFTRNHVAGVGDGVAMFDWKQAGLQEQMVIFAKLEQPIAFTSLDDRPVDMMVALVSPERQSGLHLQKLSRLARVFRDYALLESLRDTQSVDGLVSLLTQQPVLVDDLAA